MQEFIEWCNTNNGFLTAILSILSLLISVIAVVVSLKTARMPYRKSIKLGCSYNILYSANHSTLQVSTQTDGMSITAVNTGARDVNLSFLGLAVKDKTLGKGLMKMEGLISDIGGKAIVHPTELSEAKYKASDLIKAFSKTPNARVFIYATDTEGKVYCRSLWRAKDIISHLSV